MIYPLRARLKELKDANPNSQGKDNTPEAKLKDLKNGEQRGHQIETNRGQDTGHWTQSLTSQKPAGYDSSAPH